MTTQTNAAVTTAVQNTQDSDTNLHGKSTGQVVNDVSKEDLRGARAAILAAYDIVIRKDGYDDTAKRLEGLRDDIGEKVYDVLKLAIVHCENKLPIVKAYFAALCKKAEEYFLSKYIKDNKEETTIAKAIPLWPAYKSSMLKGLDMKMSPEENIPDTDAPRWPTASKFRTEVQKREKEAKGGNGQAGNDRNTSQQTTNVVNLVSKGWSPMLAGAMNVLSQALNRLNHEQQDKFASKVLALGEEVTLFADSAAPMATAPVAPVASEPVQEELDAGTKAALQAALDKEKDSDVTTPAGQRKLGEQTGKGRKGAKAA